MAVREKLRLGQSEQLRISGLEAQVQDNRSLLQMLMDRVAQIAVQVDSLEEHGKQSERFVYQQLQELKAACADLAEEIRRHTQ